MPETVSTIVAYAILPVSAIFVGLLVRYFFQYGNLLISSLTILMLLSIILIAMAMIFGLGKGVGFAFAGLFLVVSFGLLFFFSSRQSKKSEKKIKYITTSGIIVLNLLLVLLNLLLFLFAFFTAFVGSVGFFIVPMVISIIVLLYFHILTIKKQKQIQKKPYALYVNILGLLLFLVFSIFYNIESSAMREKFASNESDVIAPVQRILFPGSIATSDDDTKLNDIGALIEDKIKQKKSGKISNTKDGEEATGSISETKKETVVSPEGFDDSDLQIKKDVKIEKEEIKVKGKDKAE